MGWGNGILLQGQTGTVLRALGSLCLLGAAILFILTFFIKGRWYPKWYHDYPGHHW